MNSRRFGFKESNNYHVVGSCPPIMRHFWSEKTGMSCLPRIVLDGTRQQNNDGCFPLRKTITSSPSSSRYFIRKGSKVPRDEITNFSELLTAARAAEENFAEHISEKPNTKSKLKQRQAQSVLTAKILVTPEMNAGNALPKKIRAAEE
ncbi:hypothetical protein BDFB_011425 [Asbolus verrucosus]|uniref:Uncharacterized protein n=1 Tax=Asbolus verrucosus TaxID=1661398 RepID=A0A482VFE5_ASBVE|nr:hypothetical protein BDFB_011425 [Asbolus verrucosus]